MPHSINNNTWCSYAACILAIAASSCSSIPANKLTPADPWENANRATYRFNTTIDSYAFKPLAQGYDAITPTYLQTRISNFFSNISEPWYMLHNTLQGEGEDAIQSLMRFAFNTTFGIFGLLDIASELGMEQRQESLGLTLGKWGLGRGPYLMLPLFGPSTTRQATAALLDFTAYDKLTASVPDTTKIPLRALELLQLRAGLLPHENAIFGDEYVFIRTAYLQILVAAEQDHLQDSDAIDSFEDDYFDDDDWYDDPATTEP